MTNGGAGPSRRVADMDMAKLYRKRAIDRENQRNLRYVAFEWQLYNLCSVPVAG
jgi:hypothetical protein